MSDDKDRAGLLAFATALLVAASEPEPPGSRSSVCYRTGGLTLADYDEAIADLTRARQQLAEWAAGEGQRVCRVCEDSDHTAERCHHNPLVLARLGGQALLGDVYACFHCGHVAVGDEAARAHFGTAESEIAECLRARVGLSLLLDTATNAVYMLEGLDRRGGLGHDVHERLGSSATALRKALAGLDAEPDDTEAAAHASARARFAGFVESLADTLGLTGQDRQFGILHPDENLLTAVADLVVLREQAARGRVSVSLQQRVDVWLLECFGETVARDQLERADRLCEEVLELLQATGYPRERIAALVDYTYMRPTGEPAQEVGGVMLTLAAFCLARGIDMHTAGDIELTRVWTKIEKIRAKQATKPTGSALPVALYGVAPLADRLAKLRAETVLDLNSIEHWNRMNPDEEPLDASFERAVIDFCDGKGPMPAAPGGPLEPPES